MSTQSSDIARMVRTLLAFQDRSRAELAQTLGVHVSAVNKALVGHRSWSAVDIAIMSEFFGVSPMAFYETPDNLGIYRCICSELVSA